MNEPTNPPRWPEITDEEMQRLKVLPHPFNSGPAGLFERIAFTAAFTWIVGLSVRLLRRDSVERRPI